MLFERISISTGGGDAPGLNAVIRAIVLSAINRGWECYGIRDGYNGLLMPRDYPHGGLIKLHRDSVRGITHLGGTILGTTNTGNPLRYPTVAEDGQVYEKDRIDELVSRFKQQKLDALIAIGGDGSLEIAYALHKKGLQVVCVPKTIDNDLDKTVITFGFDTAVHFATECLDRLHSTAEAHRRIMVVEVMGRYAGWIALHAGVAATADAILIPEIPFDINKVADKVIERDRRGRQFSVTWTGGATGRNWTESLQRVGDNYRQGSACGHIRAPTARWNTDLV
jgi:6-phosphofructokinase 1